MATWYRQAPGLAWLIAVVLVPLLVAAIGWGTADRSRSQTETPGGALPTLNESPAVPAPPGDRVPGPAFAPVSLLWSGSTITLDGELPDDLAKRTLLDTLIEAVGSDVNIVDNVVVNPDVVGLDFAAAGPVFTAAAAIDGFSFIVDGDTITLAGTADSDDAADTVEDAAERAWPQVNIVDEIETE